MTVKKQEQFQYSDRPKAASYTDRIYTRAERAICCTSFQLDLFTAMIHQSVPLPTIAGQRGVENGYSQKPLTESSAEAQLMWLIQVGLLRREVDGQGLTDSFRLTPLGREIINKFKKTHKSLPKPSGLDRFKNWLSYWLR